MPDPDYLVEHYQCELVDASAYDLVTRRDWQIAYDWITKEVRTGSVLDIGCFDGSFLENFTQNWNLYGIEINPFAAGKALSKGINIITDNFYKMSHLSGRYNAITAFDVIEHVVFPFMFLSSIAQITETNGYVILSSANTETLSWRLMKNKYWYCSLPEHIVFINIPWCHFVAERCDLEIQYIEPFSHGKGINLRKQVKDVGKNIAYLMAPGLFSRLRRIRHGYLDMNSGEKFRKYPPYWITSKDHFVVVFRKKQ